MMPKKRLPGSLGYLRVLRLCPRTLTMGGRLRTAKVHVKRGCQETKVF
jgi:hypothetical protein